MTTFLLLSYFYFSPGILGSSHYGDLRFCQCPLGTYCTVCAETAPVTQTKPGTSPTRTQEKAPHREPEGFSAAGKEGVGALGNVQGALR